MCIWWAMDIRPHQWGSGSMLKTDRQQVPCSIPGHNSQERIERYIVVSFEMVQTGKYSDRGDIRLYCM